MATCPENTSQGDPRWAKGFGGAFVVGRGIGILGDLGFGGIKVRKEMEDWQKEQGGGGARKVASFPWGDFGKGEQDTRPCDQSKLPAE